MKPRPTQPLAGIRSISWRPKAPSSTASACASLANEKGKSRTTNSLIVPTSCAGDIIEISTVPPCIAAATCCSPPSVPFGKILTLILPTLFWPTTSTNFWAPRPCGWSIALTIGNLRLRSLMSAASPWPDARPSAATIASGANSLRTNCVFMIDPSPVEKNMLAAHPPRRLCGGGSPVIRWFYLDTSISKPEERPSRH